MKGLIVRFDFSGAPEALGDWRRFAREESVPRFERLAGLRHKLFMWRDDPPEAVTVYLFDDDAAFDAYAGPLLSGASGFTTTARFGVPATMELLDVAGVADGPGWAPGG